MNPTDNQNIWQVNAGGQIYEARFEDLPQWIYEGSLLPQDLVKRGNLRWIEAGKVPALMQFFNAGKGESDHTVFSSTANNPNYYDQNNDPIQNFNHQSSNTSVAGNLPVNEPQLGLQASAEFVSNFDNPAFQAHAADSVSQKYEPAADEFNLMPTAHFCSLHPERASKYLCGTCGNGFCSGCPKSYGGTVKICPFCGAMCKSVEEVEVKFQAAAQYEYDVTKGFGVHDFFSALAYPFRFKASLFFGAIMYMIFYIGQSAIWMGNIFLIAASFFCFMLANMLTFGILANTIDNFAQGKVGVNFMPSFDDFSIWDDVLHPFFLSMGTILVSFGLFFAIVIGAFFWGMSQASTMMSDSVPDSQNAPFLYDKQNIVKNNPALKKQSELYGNRDVPDEDKIKQLQNNPNYNEEEEFKKLNELINEQRKKQLEAGLGQSPDTQRQQQEIIAQRILQNGAVILLLVVVSLIWGIFYYPAACCVAGYTRSFVATLKPSIGLETIKILGWDYAKIWLMTFLLFAAANIIIWLLRIIFLPFEMPTVGNLPAQIVGALFSFYFSVVFSVVLGFAIYKNADKLNLFRN